MLVVRLELIERLLCEKQAVIGLLESAPFRSFTLSLYFFYNFEVN